MESGKQKHVIVTGASSGIGFDTAHHLARSGFQVHAGVRKQKDFEAWAGHENVHPFFLDVTSDDSCAAAARSLASTLEKAAEVHLVNNAGIAVVGPVEGVPLADWHRQFDVNVLGVVRAVKNFLPFVRATRGRVVNISSVSGLTALPFFGPYSASKFAVEALNDALRRELFATGVKVIAVEPGPVQTPIWEKNRAQDPLGILAPDLRLVYEAPMQKLLALAEESARQAVPVRLASGTVLLALTAPRPRARYLVVAGFDGVQTRLLRWLPTRWVDGLLGRMLFR